MNNLTSERSRQEQYLNTSAYSFISQEKEIQNDKARIKRKIFLDKISLKNNSFKPSYENNNYNDIDNDNDDINDIDELSLRLNNSMAIDEKMQSYNQQTSVIPINNQIPQIKMKEKEQDDSPFHDESNKISESSFTAKFDDNTCVNPKGKFLFETDKLINDVSNNDDYYNIVSSHRYEDGSLKGNTITNNVIVTTSSGNSNYKKATDNNNNGNSFYSINNTRPQLMNHFWLQNKTQYKKGQSYNIERFASFKDHPNATIRNLFCDSKPNDQTSVRGYDDEYFITDKQNNSFKFKNTFNYKQNYNENMNSSSFKFIGDIKEKNSMLKCISLKKLLTINKQCFFHLFLFIYDNYQNLLLTHTSINQKLTYTLQDKYNYIINTFKTKYGLFLNIEKSELRLSEQKQKTIFKQQSIFSMILTINILHWKHIKELYNKNLNNVSYEIGFNYTSNKHQTHRKFISIYKFDIHDSKAFPLWFCSEREEFKHKVKRVITTTSIQVFSWKDTFIIKINLIQNNGELIENIEWLPIKFEIPPSRLYEKDMSKLGKHFDYLRFCELENVVCLWKKENTITNNNQLLANVKRIFEKNFILLEVKYDILKIMFIRIKMKANKIGLFDNELFIKCKLQIVESDCVICNEIIPIICVNSINNNESPFQIRKDTIVYLYLTDFIGE